MVSKVFMNIMILFQGSTDGKVLLDDIWSMNINTLTWKKCSINLSFRTAFHASAIGDVSSF